MKTPFDVTQLHTTRLLADGAWGTELFKRGVPAGDAPERLNLIEPETVRAVATEYLEAGADIILTNTFGGSRFQLERHGLGNDVREINRIAAEISKAAAAAEDRAVVAGNIGPSGKMLMMGDVDRDALYDAFLEQAAALVEGGIDLLLVESMTDIEESLAGLDAARDARGSANIPIIASMVYDPVKTGGYRTIMGNSPDECAERAIETGAEVIGANCGTGIENYLDLAIDLCALDVAPVWIKPNRGIPEVANGETVYRQTADEFAGYAKKLLEAGVTVIGGCCGTNPSFVRAMRAVVDRFND